MIDNIRSSTSGLVLRGDGRADSPGHSAKYGSYCMVDIKTNMVLDIHLVQSNEVKSSNHVELESLKRYVEFLVSKTNKVSGLVTDQHVQVAKLMHEEYPEIYHRYDVWRVGKGISKMLD